MAITATQTRHFETETADGRILRGNLERYVSGLVRVDAELVARHSDGAIYRSLRFDASYHPRTNEAATVIVWIMGSFDSDLFRWETDEPMSGCDLLNAAIAAAASTTGAAYIAEAFGN